MKLADSLVVLHEASLQQVPQVFRTKTRVIYPSVVLTDGLAHRPEGEGFSVIMSGNMRPEKNPQLVAAAQELIPDNVHIHIYGDFSGASTPRMQNHGVVSHDKMLAAMSRAHVLLNTSFQEGGANAICEAVSMGLPVIASAIPGNIGMLGEDYAGLFKSNDLTELCEILEKAAKNPDFYAQLKGQVAARAPLFTYEQEASAWREQFQDLSN